MATPVQKGTVHCELINLPQTISQQVQLAPYLEAPTLTISLSLPHLVLQV